MSTSDPAGDTDVVAAIVRSRLFDAEPHRIGRFAVLERLGAGGMGVVYAAFDAELDRRVAIKVLFAGADDRGRLAREAQVMARLNHPNVAQIFEVGRHGDATYVAMEHVRGKTLRAWIEQAKPMLRERLAALVQAGRGLAAAHAAGVIHRDFKPDNVMMGDDGRVRVLDFGLARDLGAGELVASAETSTRSSAPTSTASGAGTPAYMAPEQWRGEAIDARADVYAFCVTAWEILSGHRPFGEASLDELRRERGEQPRLAPGASLPRWIERALRRGLAAELSERTASIGQLLVELGRDPAARRRRLLIGAAALASIAGVLVWQRAVEVRRARACADEAASIDDVWNAARADEIATAFAGTGLAHAPDAFARARVRLDAFASAWKTEREDACLAGRADEGAIACLDDGRTRAQVLVDRIASPEREIVALAIGAAAALPDPHACADPRAAVLHAERSSLGPEARARLVEIDVMRQTAAYEEALAAAELLIADLGSRGAAAQLAKGGVLRELGRHAESREALEAAYYGAGAAGDDLTSLHAAIGLVDTVGIRLADETRAREWAKVAHMYIARLDLDGEAELASLESTVGALSKNVGQVDGALAAHRRALEIRERIFGEIHPAVADSYAHIGSSLADRGDVAGGMAALRRAMEIDETIFGPDHPEVSRVLETLGHWLLQRGEYEEALASLQRALAIQEAVLGADHETVGQTLVPIVSLDLLAGRIESALAHGHRALEIAEASFTGDHPRIAGALATLAHAYEVKGDVDTARQQYRRALEMQERAVGPNDASLVPMLGNLGILLLNMDDTDGAAELLGRANQILIEQLGRDNADRAIVLGALASAETSRKRPEAALVLLEEALDIMIRAGLSPAQRADIEFQLGRALLNLDRDHARALELARSAEASWRAMGPTNAEHADTAVALIGALERAQAEARR